ncbi:MAG: GNAT family N-acetyltransferase [Chloroflexi bacterium]|nr:GNAT family N-acetyltransferase [Chloroflexota bacterium]
MAWTVVSYTNDDLPQIGLFFKHQYTGNGTYGDMGLFQWKIVDNYLMPGVINLIKDQDEIVSTTSVTPKSLIFRGSRISSAEIGDTYTDTRYQRQGMFSLVGNKTRENAIEKGIEFIYGLPNDQALPGWKKKANFEVISNLTVKSMAIPLNIGPQVQRMTHWIPGSIAGSVSPILAFFYLKLRNMFSFSDRTLAIEEIQKLPEDWEEFWDQAKSPYEFIIERDTKALKWRYFNCPNKYRFLLVRKNGKICGYLVYRIVPGEGVSYLFLADYLFLPGQETAMIPLLKMVLNTAFKYQVNAIRLWCVQSSPYFSILKRFGFLPRENVPVIGYRNDFTASLSECRSWHFTIADSDNV